MVAPMMRLLPYDPTHAAGVVALILPIQQLEFGVPITLEAQPDLQDIPAFYQRGVGHFWVALDEDRVVGTIGLLDIGHRQAALRKMFVAASHRGARHGVAQGLLDTLLSWAIAHDITEVFLGTTERFLAAHRFYEKQGFVEIQNNQLPVTFPVMAVDSKFYRRTLD